MNGQTPKFSKLPKSIYEYSYLRTKTCGEAPIQYNLYIAQNWTKMWNRCRLQETLSRQPEGVGKKVRYLRVLE